MRPAPLTFCVCFTLPTLFCCINSRTLLRHFVFTITVSSCITFVSILCLFFREWLATLTFKIVFYRTVRMLCIVLVYYRLRFCIADYPVRLECSCNVPAYSVCLTGCSISVRRFQIIAVFGNMRRNIFIWVSVGFLLIIDICRYLTLYPYKTIITQIPVFTLTYLSHRWQ